MKKQGSESSFFRFLVGTGLFLLGFGCSAVLQRHDCLLSSSSSWDILPSIGSGNSPGWKTIHVFYGNAKHIEQYDTDKRAQAQQDAIVAGLLHNKRNGYYVDLAAHDAIYLSNTVSLEKDLNWRGLCIEANPQYWRALTYRKCDVVAAAVGAENMDEVDFQLSHDGALGGIEGEDFDNKPGQSARKPVKYYTVSFRDILKRMGSPRVMDYLSLDVEGAEYFIMQKFPFTEYRFRLLTVERPKPELKKLLTKHGYEELCTISSFGETLWVSTQDKALLDLSFRLLPEECRM